MNQPAEKPTGPTPGPWKIGAIGWRGGDDRNCQANLVAPAVALGCVWGETLEEAEATARLIVRLSNLHFAGQQREEKRTAEVFEAGDIPPNPDYDLSENEIAAAKMLNALMDENAELLETITYVEDALGFHEGSEEKTHEGGKPVVWINAEGPGGDLQMMLAKLRAAIAKATQ